MRYCADERDHFTLYHGQVCGMPHIDGVGQIGQAKGGGRGLAVGLLDDTGDVAQRFLRLRCRIADVHAAMSDDAGGAGDKQHWLSRQTDQAGA